MDYIVTFTKDVTLYDAKHGFVEVKIKKGKYRMINSDNPLQHNASLELSPWIIIKGTKIGISYVAFEKFGFKIEKTNLRI